MKSASITVAFRHPPAIETLQQLKSVTTVQAKKDGRMHIFHETGHNPTDDILRLAVENNWGLYEIRPGRLSLEQLFLELTTDSGDTVTTEAPAITDTLEGRT